MIKKIILIKKITLKLNITTYNNLNILKSYFIYTKTYNYKILLNKYYQSTIIKVSINILFV
jgi:hypothetical protein